MNKQEFDVIRDFTMSVKRGPKPDAMVLKAAEAISVGGDKRVLGFGADVRRKARQFIVTMDFYGALLVRYAAGDKYGAYKAKHEIQTAPEIWNAAITGNKANLNNSQKVCVGVLAKRIKMWDGFAEKLNKARGK